MQFTVADKAGLAVGQTWMQDVGFRLLCRIKIILWTGCPEIPELVTLEPPSAVWWLVGFLNCVDRLDYRRSRRFMEHLVRDDGWTRSRPTVRVVWT